MAPDAAPRPTRVGVREVAAVAGVSPQTVSRVINEHPNIRPETRARVLEAMATLDYRVNNAARSLGTATTRTLGVIASDATLFGPAVGIAALESAARATGRWVTTTYANASEADSIDAAARHLYAQGVDGIVVVAGHSLTLELVRAAAPGVPAAVLHDSAGSSRQADGVAALVSHLAELGHRRIARLDGPIDWIEAAVRAAAADQALEQHGVRTVAQWQGDWSAEAGYAVAPEVADAVRGSDAPTAVLVANDQMALGLMAGLDAAGIVVPTQLSVAGFDDNPDAAYYRPALTTVRVDLAGEARRCVAEVLGLVAAEASAEPEVIVRASTAAPAPILG